MINLRFHKEERSLLRLTKYISIAATLEDKRVFDRLNEYSRMVFKSFSSNSIEAL
jgi:hypothetical protein